MSTDRTFEVDRELGKLIVGHQSVLSSVDAH